MKPDDAPAFRAAPLDGAARAAILVAVALMAVLVWWLVTAALASPGRWNPAMLLALALLAVLAPASVADLLRAPVGYSVEDGLLRIHRRFAKPLTFEMAGPAERFDDAGRLRRRGVFYGCRWLPEHHNPGLRHALKERGPSMYVAVTDLSRAVRVEIARGSAVVTPALPEAFIEATRWRS